MRCNKPCPRKRTSEKRHVCFTTESGATSDVRFGSLTYVSALAKIAKFLAENIKTM
jgi:hypothetical protein